MALCICRYLAKYSIWALDPWYQCGKVCEPPKLKDGKSPAPLPRITGVSPFYFRTIKRGALLCTSGISSHPITKKFYKDTSVQTAMKNSQHRPCITSRVQYLCACPVPGFSARTNTSQHLAIQLRPISPPNRLNYDIILGRKTGRLMRRFVGALTQFLSLIGIISNKLKSFNCSLNDKATCSRRTDRTVRITCFMWFNRA